MFIKMIAKSSLATKSLVCYKNGEKALKFDDKKSLSIYF